jgi:hypothetical protein
MKFQKHRLAQLSDKLILEITFWMNVYKQISKRVKKMKKLKYQTHKIKYLLSNLNCERLYYQGFNSIPPDLSSSLSSTTLSPRKL